MTSGEPGSQLPAFGGLLLLLIRGVLLWLVVPASLLWWVFAWPFLRRRQVRLSQLLGWVDLNLVAAIECTLLRPLVRSRLAWTPVSAMPTVKHRIGFLDPV